MRQLAFSTVTGSTYVVRFQGGEGIDVVRVSDHPIAGRGTDTSFAEVFASIEFVAQAGGVRVHFRSTDRSRDFWTSVLRDVTDVVSR